MPARGPEVGEEDFEELYALSGFGPLFKAILGEGAIQRFNDGVDAGGVVLFERKPGPVGHKVDTAVLRVSFGVAA